MTDSYYIGTACGHFWSSPHPPDDRRCESCSTRNATTVAYDLYSAETKSQRIVDAKAARA